MCEKENAWPVLLGCAVHSCIAAAVFTHVLHCPFSHPFHLGISSSDRDFITAALERWRSDLLRVSEVKVTQITDTESGEEYFRCKAGCRCLLGTLL